MAESTAARSRPFRIQARQTGQTSPPPIAFAAIKLVRGTVVADVGCGNGAYGYLLRSLWSQTESWNEERMIAPERLVGIDLSPAAVAIARRHAIYEELHVASCTDLPLASASVDTALCLETLEHLHAASVGPALCQLQRIARERVVVTTPVPWRAVETDWLAHERAEAAKDPEPLHRDEYLALASAVHKAWLEPQALERAGFQHDMRVIHGSLVYHGVPRRLCIERLGEVQGVPEHVLHPSDDGRGDWRTAYVELLDAVLEMGARASRLSGPLRLASQRLGRRWIRRRGRH